MTEIASTNKQKDEIVSLVSSPNYWKILFMCIGGGKSKVT